MDSTRCLVDIEALEAWLAKLKEQAVKRDDYLKKVNEKDTELKRLRAENQRLKAACPDMDTSEPSPHLVRSPKRPKKSKK